MSIAQDEIQKILKQLPPEQRHFAEAVTTMKLENRTLRQQITDLKSAYDELWKVIIVILHAQPGNELRIHESQFLRFKHEYRVDRTVDKDKHEVVLRLLTLHDEVKNET